MTEALAVSKVQSIKDRRTSLISSIMHTNADSAKKFVMQQEVKRITLVLNQQA